MLLALSPKDENVDENDPNDNDIEINDNNLVFINDETDISNEHLFDEEPNFEAGYNY